MTEVKETYDTAGASNVAVKTGFPPRKKNFPRIPDAVDSPAAE
jgi:hypothetical protein